jgi:hypothetical protein
MNTIRYHILSLHDCRGSLNNLMIRLDFFDFVKEMFFRGEKEHIRDRSNLLKLLLLLELEIIFDISYIYLFQFAKSQS